MKQFEHNDLLDIITADGEYTGMQLFSVTNITIDLITRANCIQFVFVPHIPHMFNYICISFEQY